MASCGHRTGPPALAQGLVEAHMLSHSPHHTRTLNTRTRGGTTPTGQLESLLLTPHLPPPPTGTQGSDKPALPFGLLGRLRSVRLFAGLTCYQPSCITDARPGGPRPACFLPPMWGLWGTAGSGCDVRTRPIKVSPCSLPLCPHPEPPQFQRLQNVPTHSVTTMTLNLHANKYLSSFSERP